MTKLPFEKFLCAPQESFLLLSFYGGLLAISRFGEGETENKKYLWGIISKTDRELSSTCLLKGEDGSFKNGVWWGFVAEDNLEIMDIVQKLLKMALANKNGTCTLLALLKLLERPDFCCWTIFCTFWIKVGCRWN